MVFLDLLDNIYRFSKVINFFLPKKIKGSMHIFVPYLDTLTFNSNNVFTKNSIAITLLDSSALGSEHDSITTPSSSPSHPAKQKFYSLHSIFIESA